MITVDNVSILDLLPYTFKTEENQALSEAISKLTVEFYAIISKLLFWSDIENADSKILDAMAAELDVPFYTTDLSDTQKRSIIAAAFTYKSRIGTVYSVEKAIESAFGGGKVSEWYQYDGNPFYFKVDITRSENTTMSYNNFDYFLNTLEKIKNKRAKLENIIIRETLQNKVYFASKIARHKRYITI